MINVSFLKVDGISIGLITFNKEKSGFLINEKAVREIKKSHDRLKISVIKEMIEGLKELTKNGKGIELKDFNIFTRVVSVNNGFLSITKAKRIDAQYRKETIEGIFKKYVLDNFQFNYENWIIFVFDYPMFWF